VRPDRSQQSHGGGPVRGDVQSRLPCLVQDEALRKASITPETESTSKDPGISLFRDAFRREYLLPIKNIK